MKTTLHVLNASFGDMEGTLWSKLQTLSSEQFDFNDGSRCEKGIKPGKMTVCTENNNALGRRLYLENYPCDLSVTLSQSVKGGDVSYKVTDYTVAPNSKAQG